MKITLPEGFQIPQDTKAGEAFEVVAMIKPQEDGSFNMVSLDGVELMEEEEDDEEEMKMAQPDIKIPFEEMA